MTFEQLALYLLPPLLGALIGYVTNYVAIRMLFRPLRPWRVMGARVPLTPGIIPAKRGELAEKMGEMVGSHLLTADDVGRTLNRDAFRRELRSTVAEKLSLFLDRDLGPAESLVPAAYRERFRELVDLLRWKLVNVIFEYLESDEFAGKLREFLRRKGNELLARDLDSFLTPHDYEKLRRHLDEKLRECLHSEVVAQSVAGLVEGKAERLFASHRPLKELLPEGITDFVFAQVEKEVPPLLEKFGGMLYDPVFRDRLVAKARTGIESFLDSLQGLAGLLTGFVNLDKLYARIPEFLDQASDEIARWLREEKTQRQVAETLRERLEKALEHSPASLTEKVSYEKISQIRFFLRGRSLELVHSPKTAEMLLASVEKGVVSIKDRSFRDLTGKVLPSGGAEKMQEQLADKLLAFLRSPEARQAFSEALAEQAQKWLYHRPLGRLSARLPADIREELEDGIYRQLVEALMREVPPLVESLNVRRMVTEKVNSLDILKVEGLLLGIMQEQFKYINLFGALLGALIGLANVVILSFLR